MPQKVKFKHCDPAGIVFYPRYFEMINDCVEAFFDTDVGYPFEDMHIEGGVPTAEITCKFNAPSRHGDMLALTLDVMRVGRSSLGLEVIATCDAQRRFEARATLVLVDTKGRPRAWPDALRDRLEAQRGGAA